MKKSVLFLVTIFTLSSVLVASAQELKIGTIFPKKSPWGKVMSAWAKVVKKKSKGKLKIKYFFNAQQGDEDILIAKIRSGQLDGAW